MRGISKPIPETNYRSKKKSKKEKIQGNNKSFKILLLWRLSMSGWPHWWKGRRGRRRRSRNTRMSLMMEEKKKRRQKKAPMKEERRKRGCPIPALALTPNTRVSYKQRSRESGRYRRWETPLLSHQKSDVTGTYFGFWLKEEASPPPYERGELS